MSDSYVFHDQSEPIKADFVQRERLYEAMRHELEMAGYAATEAVRIAEILLKALGKA